MLINTMAQHYYSFMLLLFEPEKNKQGSEMSLTAAILYAWPFFILGEILSHAFSSLMIDQLLSTASSFSGLGTLRLDLLHFPMSFGLLFSFFSILFFPLKHWLVSSYFNLVIGLFQRGNTYLESDHTLGLDLYASSLSSHVFLMIPIIGPTLQSISCFTNRWIGLKRRMHIGGFSAFCLLMAPTIFLLLLSLVSLYTFFLFLFF
jgi:hypothetical protein